MSSQKELSIISNASTTIVSNLDIQRMLNSLIEELKEIADISWAAITRVNGNNIQHLALSDDVNSPHEPVDQMPVTGTACEWIVTQRTAIVEPDLLQDSRFTNDKQYIKQGIRSVAYLPLQKGKKITGYLTLASRTPNAYDHEFVGILEQLTPLIAAQIENAHLYNEAVELARIDELTGLHNRRALQEMITNEIKRCSRYGGMFSLVLLDIDTLKPVNDTYGHLAGDEYIRQVGSIIQKTVRSTDRAFRHGGDEFAILLPQTAINDATRVAERVRQQVASATSKTGTPITCSLGVANWPASGPGVTDLINAADMALYQAKRQGRNQSNNDIATSPENGQASREPSSISP